MTAAGAVAASLGQPLSARALGDGSDGNKLVITGLPLLQGVGPCGGGMHSDHKFMQLSSYPQRLALPSRLIPQLIAH